PACNPGTGLCTHPPVPDGTTCPDTDNAACTTAACLGGVCDQSFVIDCPPIDHFLCYEAKPSAFATGTVTVQDPFTTVSGSLRFAHRLCPPVSKNNEGILDPTDHLVGYSTRFSKAPTQTNQTFVDQFGSLQLDLTRVDLLMVPSSKDGVPQQPPLDHFQC